MTPQEDREWLFELGVDRARAFCDLNEIEMPEIRHVRPVNWRFRSVCAYYRPTYVAICVERCASRGYGGRSWSWPGYAVDRTPYGVIAHELGHHVDYGRSTPASHAAYWGDFSKMIRAESGEPALTGYRGEDDQEWFAEMFRLFVTNSSLLYAIRVRTYAAIVNHGLKPLETPTFNPFTGMQVDGVPIPERHVAAVTNRIEAAERHRSLL